MDERITRDELHDLRKLLDKLRDEPGFPEQARSWINGVMNMTSVVLDDRRQGENTITPVARLAVTS